MKFAFHKISSYLKFLRLTFGIEQRFENSLISLPLSIRYCLTLCPGFEALFPDFVTVIGYRFVSAEQLISCPDLYWLTSSKHAILFHEYNSREPTWSCSFESPFMKTKQIIKIDNHIIVQPIMNQVKDFKNYLFYGFFTKISPFFCNLHALKLS